MRQYLCPICNKRACDSVKNLHLEKLSKENSDRADIIVKCKNCKNKVVIEISNAFNTSKYIVVN